MSLFQTIPQIALVHTTYIFQHSSVSATQLTLLYTLSLIACCRSHWHSILWRSRMDSSHPFSTMESLRSSHEVRLHILHISARTLLLCATHFCYSSTTRAKEQSSWPTGQDGWFPISCREPSLRVTPCHFHNSAWLFHRPLPRRTSRSLLVCAHNVWMYEE